MIKTKKKCFTALSALILSFSLAGCSETGSSVNESSTTEKKIVSFLGDSITYGYLADTCFATLVGQDLNVSIRNLGSIGSTVGSLSQTADSSFVSRYTKINSESSIIFVLGGTNDYGADDPIPLGEYGDTEKNTFYGALDTLMNGLLTDCPDSKVIFGTPMQRDDEIWGSPETSPYNSLGYTLEDYRDAIVEMCGKYEIEYVDFYNTEGFRLSDENFADYFVDGLHPNNTGHRLAADVLIEVFEQYL